MTLEHRTDQVNLSLRQGNLGIALDQ
jgi:hypothetical protein